MAVDFPGIQAAQAQCCCLCCTAMGRGRFLSPGWCQSQLFKLKELKFCSLIWDMITAHLYAVVCTESVFAPACFSLFCFTDNCLNPEWGNEGTSANTEYSKPPSLHIFPLQKLNHSLSRLVG